MIASSGPWQKTTQQRWISAGLLYSRLSGGHAVVMEDRTLRMCWPLRGGCYLLDDLWSGGIPDWQPRWTVDGISVVFAKEWQRGMVTTVEKATRISRR